MRDPAPLCKVKRLNQFVIVRNSHFDLNDRHTGVQIEDREARAGNSKNVNLRIIRLDVCELVKEKTTGGDLCTFQYIIVIVCFKASEAIFCCVS